MVVVDLSIEGDEIAAARAPHRLVAGARQIENGKTAVAEGQRTMAIDTLVVGTAALERARHGLDDGAVILFISKSKNPRNSAHGVA
jgi:hypothetical protein